MSGSSVLNSTAGRAVLTGGMSLVPELVGKPLVNAVLKKTAPEQPADPLAPPAPPNPNDPATSLAMQEASAKERQARGRASTIYAGRSSANSASGLLAKRTLLGA